MAESKFYDYATGKEVKNNPEEAYRQLFEENIGVTVESVNLIWFYTNYPKGTAGKDKDYKVEGSKILYKKEPLQNNEEWKQPTFFLLSRGFLKKYFL